MRKIEITIIFLMFLIFNLFSDDLNDFYNRLSNKKLYLIEDYKIKDYLLKREYYKIDIYKVNEYFEFYSDKDNFILSGTDIVGLTIQKFFIKKINNNKFLIKSNIDNNKLNIKFENDFINISVDGDNKKIYKDFYLIYCTNVKKITSINSG